MLPHRTQRLYAISNVAEEYAKQGDVDKAMEIVRSSLPPTWLDTRRVAVARALADGKHFEKAIALAEKIEQLSSRDNAYDRIAELLIRDGQLKNGEEMILFEDAQIIALIKAHYLDTALLLKQSGDDAAAKQRIEKAVAAVKAIKSQGLGKMMIHKKLIQGLSALGQTEAAKDLIGHQDTPYTKATSAGDIAASLIMAGKVDEGLKMAEQSVADRSMAYGTRRVAIALLTIQRYDRLADYMAKMPDNKREVRAFREIAQQMVTTGHVQQLEDLMDRLPSEAVNLSFRSVSPKLTPPKI